MRQPEVCSGEIFRSNAFKISVPRKPLFIRAARIEWRHIRIKASDDLHDVESFGHPVSRKLVELIREMNPVAQAHPPGIAQPKEGRSIRVLEMPPIRRNSDRAMFEKTVGPLIRHDF